MSNTDQIAIVTGASSGIGQAAAIEVARRGMRVVLTYQGNAEGADQTVETIVHAGGAAVPLPLDLGRAETFPAFAQAAAGEIQARWGRATFDHLVNNGGFAEAAPFADTGEELLDRLYRVLLKGPFLLTQQLLPLMADGGAIVNTTSSSALRNGTAAGYSGYATMKGGLAVLTRYMAKELSPRGIRVNAIAPGPTRTRLGGNAFERFPEVIAPLVERTALGRLGEGEDVGRAIAALLGPDGAWITGEHIEVSGGFDL